MDLLASAGRRRLLFLLLYLSEGAPIGFLWWAFPAVLRSRGVAVEAITTLTAFLSIPWAFKFLWAPVVDVFSSPRFGLRLWILSAQVLMGLTLLPVAVLDASADTTTIIGVLMFHAIAASTQDVAIDTLAIRTVPVSERGRINGWMQTGMLLGRAAFGGATLIVVSSLGITGAVILLVALLLATSTFVLMSREPVVSAAPARVREALDGVVSALRSAATRPSTWAGLVFAAIAGAGFEAAGALAGPFLIDRGRTTESVGLFFSLVSLPAMAAGALAGGRASDSFSPRRVTVLGLLWLCAVLGALAAADIAGRHDALVPLLALLYLGIGVFTAGSYSLFMEITDRRLGATQFSAFMGATNLCESWSSVAGGKIAGVAGYATAFAVMGAASAVGFAIVPWIRPKKGKPSADTSQRALFHGQRAHDERHC